MTLSPDEPTPPLSLALEMAEILRILPHRYPFLLVDRVVELLPGERILALKNVTMNEPFFQGHFPGHPVMPGVLLVEGMAQAGAILMTHDLEDRDSKLIYFMGIEKARFRRPVTPGDQLHYEVGVLHRRSSHCRLEGKVRVDGKVAAEAIISSAMVDR